LNRHERAKSNINISCRKALSLEKLVHDQTTPPIFSKLFFNKIFIPAYNKIVAYLFTLLSIVIFLGEITINIWPESNDFLGTIFVTYLNSAFLNAVVLTLMGYIVYSVLFGLF